MNAGSLAAGVALILCLYFRKRIFSASRFGPIAQAIIVMVIAATAAATVRGVISIVQPWTISTDEIITKARSYPLMGIVLKEFPEAEAKMRAAIEYDRRNPPGNATSRSFAAGMEIRQTYIMPVLERASDEAIIAMSTAQGELIRRLQTSNLAACRSYVVAGIERPDLLATDDRVLFEKMLKATEAAYYSGRSRPAGAVVSDERAGELLAMARFTAADFERLQKVNGLGDAEVCAMGLKLVVAPTLLPAQQRAELARYLIVR